MPINIKKARKNLSIRHDVRQKKLDSLFRKAQNDFNAIVAMVKKKYNPAKIVQWGSLLDRSLFTEISDIDIAVQGIECAEQYFALLKDADNLTNFSIDIIQLEKLDPLHRESILKKGRIVYERPK